MRAYDLFKFTVALFLALGVSGLWFIRQGEQPRPPSLVGSRSEAVAGVPFVLTGLADPNSRVQILVEGQPVGSAEVSAAGGWSFPLTLNEPGSKRIVVQALKPDGSAGMASEALPLEVKAPPLPPQITSPQAGSLVQPGALALEGRGTPGDELEVFAGEQNLGRTTIDAEGRWRFTVTAKTGTARYEVRRVGEPTGPSVSVQVAEQPVERPLVNNSIPPKPRALCTGPFAVTAPQDGATVPRNFRLTGTGGPEGSEYTVYINGRPRWFVRVNNRCAWGMTSDPGVGTFRYEFRKRGNPSGPVLASLTLTVPGAAQPIRQTYVVQENDALERIARRYGISPNDLLAANPQIKDPDQIFPGTRLVIP
ncbi:hypothetical protein DNA98_09190 [Meiothermus sp. Pnk-1]|nr:hypothetical protein DNA98_09190 [Meiothermus sp. Pnk-1]